MREIRLQNSDGIIRLVAAIAADTAPVAAAAAVAAATLVLSALHHK